jgi:hypothetical protein
MREFRAKVGRIDEPVRVGGGIWFPQSTPVLEAIGDGTAVLGVGAEISMASQDGDKYVLIIQKEEANGAS